MFSPTPSKPFHILRSVTFRDYVQMCTYVRSDWVLFEATHVRFLSFFFVQNTKNVTFYVFSSSCTRFLKRYIYDNGNSLTFISMSSRFWSTASRCAMGSTSTTVGGETGDDVNGAGGVASISRSGDLSRSPAIRSSSTRHGDTWWQWFWHWLTANKLNTWRHKR